MKRIISIEVTRSSFYKDPLKIQFSEKLNCIMGGRGTGKSTLLYFLESCLESDAEEDKITYNVLKNNLGPGVITILVEDDDGKKYKIVKSIDEVSQAYTFPTEKVISFKTISNNIICDFYKSQSIEEIGKNASDRLDLIDKMLIEEKYILQNEIEDIQMKLEENAQLIRSENIRIKQSLQTLGQYENIDEELNKLQEEKPDDLDKKQQTEFEDADKREKIRTSEKRYVKSEVDKLSEVEERLQEFLEENQTSQATKTKIDIFINREIITLIDQEYNTAIDKINELIQEASKLANKAADKIDGYNSKLEQKHLIQQNEFTKLKQKIEKNKLFYTKWNTLTKKDDEKKILLESKKKIEEKLLKFKKARTELVKKLTAKSRELFELRKEKIESINKQFKDSVKITLTYGGITTQFEDALRNALKGSNMRYNTIIPSIIDNFSPSRFAEIIHTKDQETLKKIIGIDKERSSALVYALSETEAIYEIEMMCCPDLPDFHLKVDEKGNFSAKSPANYKKSDELSTGQRCTTVLPIIFAVSDNPLIIDQPEDNLDNKYITDTIHKMIREQKEMRQLIFITHNPNIPVLATAEANFFLTYFEKKSKIDSKGSIYDVKRNILGLMEGGKEAFKKREELYQDELNEQ